jgi:hypothetical protein
VEPKIKNKAKALRNQFICNAAKLVLKSSSTQVHKKALEIAFWWRATKYSSYRAAN